jgi:hypothetical protein
MTFHECCDAIIAAGKDPKQVRQVNYAVGYAEAGKRIGTPEGQQVQALYILSNISRWRGDVAKQVRADLKKIGGVK